MELSKNPYTEEIRQGRELDNAAGLSPYWIMPANRATAHQALEIDLDAAAVATRMAATTAALQ
ncbi:hypothetical protein IPG41_04215 [Candidatus Peregrinibacteria bacterium]|nr:MAG: hypothetical protein IPG41_04215 [Candidatus Peregrinibacteria bacterium]